MVPAEPGECRLGNFHWGRQGLYFDDTLIIPFGENWNNDAQNMRLTSLVRKDRPWEIRADRKYNINLDVNVY